MVLCLTLGCSLFGIGGDKPLVLNGTIEADDILVGSKIGGRVMEVLSEEGNIVKEGDVLIRLDDAELRARWDQTLASIKQAEERVKEWEAYLDLAIKDAKRIEAFTKKASFPDRNVIKRSIKL